MTPQDETRIREQAQEEGGDIPVQKKQPRRRAYIIYEDQIDKLYNRLMDYCFTDSEIENLYHDVYSHPAPAHSIKPKGCLCEDATQEEGGDIPVQKKQPQRKAYAIYNDQIDKICNILAGYCSRNAEVTAIYFDVYSRPIPAHSIKPKGCLCDYCEDTTQECRERHKKIVAPGESLEVLDKLDRFVRATKCQEEDFWMMGRISKKISAIRNEIQERENERSPQ